MRTLLKRPDLLQKKNLTRQEIEILKKWYRVIEGLIKKGLARFPVCPKL
jgi:hypothetical protein